MKGRIIVFTGDGQGKTTASLGIALRSVAHGKKVIIIQFMKGYKMVGEFMARDLLPNYEIYQFGGEDFVDLSNPKEEDKRRAREALTFARKKIGEKPFLMILDEVNLATSIGLVSVEELLDLLRSKPEETNIILTGRYADERIIEMADV
ncbi:MAG: cob(I)yrinic acid a,c-diamide adenosyltransferase, partial [Thermoplasmata archaeon]